MADRIDPDPIGLHKLTMLFTKSLAGVGEGLVLGLAQGVMLRRMFGALDLGAWVMATVLIATFGWATGSAVSIFGAFSSGAEAVGPPLPWIIGFSVLFGLIAGALFGAAQWVALRRAAEPASIWILANAAGWAVAMPVIYLAASLDYGDRGQGVVFFTSLFAGLLAGAVVGAVTGLSFRWLEPVSRHGAMT
jgi:hypothetical protein